ncbi:hypothetical protein ACFQ3S_02655 [Mucilaginibacter terrae]|uniref:hypothetical protein n=1 Tax=Mucilaginibacter terrae TaxID=1955052 RepID=UPI003637BAAC
MKLSKFFAKLMVRMFFILILAAGVGVWQGGDKLKHLGYINLFQWRMIFPALLISGFIGLLLTASIKKYNNMELNWLLVVNTLMLIIYAMAIFMKIAYPVA